MYYIIKDINTGKYLTNIELGRGSWSVKGAAKKFPDIVEAASLSNFLNIMFGKSNENLRFKLETIIEKID